MRIAADSSDTARSEQWTTPFPDWRPRTNRAAGPESSWHRSARSCPRAEQWSYAISFIPACDHITRLVPNTRDSGPNDQPATMTSTPMRMAPGRWRYAARHAVI